jgi:hypothetical protein
VPKALGYLRSHGRPRIRADMALVTRVLVGWLGCLLVCLALGWSRERAWSTMQICLFLAVFMPSIRVRPGSPR